MITRRLRTHRRGVSMPEYALMFVVSAGVGLLTLPYLGPRVAALYGENVQADALGSSSTRASNNTGASNTTNSTTSGQDTPDPASNPPTGGAWYGNPDLGMNTNWTAPQNPMIRQETLTFLNKSANTMDNVAPYVTDASSDHITTSLVDTDCPSTLNGWQTCTATVQTNATMNGTSQATLYATRDGQYPEAIGGAITAFTQPYIAEVIGTPGVGPTPSYTYNAQTPATQAWHVITIANDLSSIMTSGTLPPGLYIDGMDDVGGDTTQHTITLNGTPTQAGTWTFDIVMQTRSELTTTQPVTITIKPTNLLQWGNNTTQATVNRYYAQTNYYLGLYNPNTSPYTNLNASISGDGYTISQSCSTIAANNGYCQIIVHFAAPAAVNATYAATVSLGNGQPTQTLSTVVTGY